MEEASQLCGRVILMDGGRILLEGAPETLIAREIGREVVELWNLEPGVEAFLRERSWTLEQAEDRLYAYDCEGGEIAAAIGERFPRQERLIRHATLEDVFLHRAGRTLREGQ